ncbi:MAG: hypothetical protein K2Q32_01460 [Alphaproteobacteria bacterium]|nr:hypothetical protein [Alphaproteobacteria bacterium]
MKKRSFEDIEIDRIFLYEENPRHEPLETEDEIISHLCKDELVFNLARSIADAGPNPLELVGVVETKASAKSGTKKTYEVWEGNRRICAIKLLNDPDLAPPHLRKDFSRLAEKYTPIKRISCVVFDDHDDLKFWMGIIHGGQQDGTGRKNWDAQQKERHVGTGRNKVALAVLDISEKMGLITKDERNGRLTTAQRYLNSGIVREALGIDASNKDNITYNRPLKELQVQLEKFIGDLKKNVKVTSRNNKDQIDAYGRQLARNPNLSGERIQPLSLSAALADAPKPTGRSAGRKKPKKKDHLEYDKGLAQAIELLQSEKLESLYYSITSVRLEANTPLLTVGVWSFIESLAARSGKNADTDFLSFFSNQKLGSYGLGNGKTVGPLRGALERIQKHGNTTKHHAVSATFEGKQLANDLSTITPILMKCIEEITSKP